MPIIKLRSCLIPPSTAALLIIRETDIAVVIILTATATEHRLYRALYLQILHLTGEQQARLHVMSATGIQHIQIIEKRRRFIRQARQRGTRMFTMLQLQAVHRMKCSAYIVTLPQQPQTQLSLIRQNT